MAKDDSFYINLNTTVLHTLDVLHFILEMKNNDIECSWRGISLLPPHTLQKGQTNRMILFITPG